MELMKSSWTRNRILGVFALIVLLGSAPFAYQWYVDATYDFVPYENLEDVNFESPKDAERYFEALEQAYRNDTYGGQTPQETFQLFIDALKDENIELAAKYFIVEKQRAMLKEFRIGKEKKNLDNLVAILERPKEGSLLQEGFYQFNTFDEGGNAEFSFSLMRNPYTGVWKVDEL